MARISPTPLMMIVAGDDETTPPSLALEAYESALEPKELVMISGGHYGVYKPDRSFHVVVDAALRWFETHLGNGSTETLRRACHPRCAPLATPHPAQTLGACASM